MSLNNNGKLVRIVEFTVRKDKYLGLLIEQFATENDEYFLRTQDQPIDKHCAQMQKIVLSENVKRTKKIKIDTALFDFDYFRNDIGMFKGRPLDSVNQQIQKLSQYHINKEIGMIKRSATVARNKPLKILKHNAKIISKMKETQAHYDVLREQKMVEAFGRSDSGLPPGSSGAPPVFSGAPPGFSGAPPGFSGAPPGFSGAPPGFSGAPPGFSGAPPGSGTFGSKQAQQICAVSPLGERRQTGQVNSLGNGSGIGNLGRGQASGQSGQESLLGQGSGLLPNLPDDDEDMDSDT